MDLNSRLVVTSNKRLRRASRCGKCAARKSIFVSRQHGRGAKTILNKAKKGVEHVGKFYRDMYRQIKKGKVPHLQRRMTGNPNSRASTEKRFQRYKKAVVKRQHEFNAKVRSGTERIREPNEMSAWMEHHWRLDNDKEYREKYMKNPMIDGDDD